MCPEVTFRRAIPADALCIGVLGMQVFLNTYATTGIRPSIAREVMQSLAPNVVDKVLANPDKTFVLMEVDAHLIGFAEITARASTALVPLSEAAELNRLYVQEPFTGRGLGKALLAEAEAVALAGGASTLWLTAWIGNARALAFYASQGYEPLGSTLFTFEGEQHENRVFAKVLKAAPMIESAPGAAAIFTLCDCFSWFPSCTWEPKNGRSCTSRGGAPAGWSDHAKPFGTPLRRHPVHAKCNFARSRIPKCNLGTKVKNCIIQSRFVVCPRLTSSSFP